MSTAARFGQLLTLGRPVVSTAESAAAWQSSLPAAAKTLARLAEIGLITKIRHGLWQVGSDAADPAAVLPALTNPYPSYISGWSALWRHGMIEQIPRATFGASLGKTTTVTTVHGRYEIHHLHPDVFGGFSGGDGLHAGVATPAKALFDTVYLLATRAGRVTLPELELPVGFDGGELERWLESVPSTRLRTLTAANLEHLIATASTQHGDARANPTVSRPH